MSESNYPAANAKAQLLIALFATSGARKTIWKGVAALIFAFLSIVLFGSLVAGPARFWELWDNDIAVLIFAFAGVSLAPLHHSLVRWAVRQWETEGKS